jgi:hypothetical protein
MPMGKFVFQVTGVFAEFERTTVRQRVKAGIKRRRIPVEGATDDCRCVSRPRREHRCGARTVMRRCDAFQGSGT